MSCLATCGGMDTELFHCITVNSNEYACKNANPNTRQFVCGLWKNINLEEMIHFWDGIENEHQQQKNWWLRSIF